MSHLNRELIEQQLSALPLAQYGWIETAELEFSERIRRVCEQECPMYGKTWACPPAVGTVEECRARCLSYPHALYLTTLTEVSDIAISTRRSLPARRTRPSRARRSPF